MAYPDPPPVHLEGRSAPNQPRLSGPQLRLTKVMIGNPVKKAKARLRKRKGKKK